MYVLAESKMKRETGVSPVRSRHCKRESVIIMSLQNCGKTITDAELKSGDQHTLGN